MNKKLKIVVAMSGGVDSSVVAAMLHEMGHEIIGVTLQLYDQGAIAGRKGACCAGQDIYDAQMVAAKLGIPHYVLDYENTFNEAVITKFVDSYIKGETPIPCVNCNQSVKFKDLVKVAKDLNADVLATGHYVRKIISKNNKSELHKGIDNKKDQSYFLFATTKEQLDYLMFPLGGMTKIETRNLATKYDLVIADKPDSQDICFVPNGDYRSVVKKIRPTAFIEGDIKMNDGSVIGKHNGIINYTIGQRKGIGISSIEPLYVIKIDAKTNTIIVGKKDELKSNVVNIRDINWIGDGILDDTEDNKFDCQVKLRSMHNVIDAEVQYIGNNSAKIKLYSDYYAVTPGQACVIYKESRVLGGGWII